MSVYIVSQRMPDGDVIIIGAFASRQPASKCALLGEMVGLSRWVDCLEVEHEYTVAEDQSVADELAESGTYCAGYDEDKRIFVFKDIEE